LKTLRLTSLLLLLLLAVTPAQQVTPELFVQSVSTWIEEGDLAKVAQGVRYQAEPGREAFRRMLEVHKLGPTESTERWLNTVARAFRLEGQKEPNQELLAADMLWPNTKWRGTLFEDDQVVDTRGTVAEKIEEKPEVAGDQFAEALAATHLAVRVGNDFALPSMLGALKKHAAKNPGLPESGELKALEVSALETTGLWSDALRLGEEYSSQVTGEDAVNLHLAMLSAARKLEKPAEVDRLLVKLDGLLQKSPNTLAEFIVKSVAFERDCQKSDVKLEELTKRHVVVWRSFQTAQLERIPGGLGRHLVEAAGIWVHESLDRMQRETGEFPNRAQLYYIVWEDLRKLRRLSKSQLALQFQPGAAQSFLRLWNPEFMLATQALELEVVASWRKHGQTDHARVLLSEVEQSVQETWEDIQQAGLGYQLAHYGKPIKLEGGQFEFVWTIGEAPRMVALQRMERAYLRDDANAVEEAIVYQKDARTQGGFLGLEDARFLKVERLIAGPRSAEAAPMNQELAALSEKNDYRPGRIVCFVNGAEIAHKAGDSASAIEQAEKAVTLIEEYLTEAGGDADIRRRFRRAYELLAELQLAAGKNEDAFATLARLGQAESVMSLNAEQIASKKPGLKDLVSKLERSRARTRALAEAKGNEVKAGKKTDQTEGLIAANRSEFYQALGDIRRQYPGYGQMLAVRPVNFARMQQFVPDDTVVVQLFPAQDALFLFVLTQKELKIKKVAVGQSVIETLAQEARSGLLKSKDRSLRDRAGRVLLTASESKGAEGSLEAFVALYKYIVAPIEEDIEPYKVVAFIPSGSLMNVPLQALARESGDSLDFLIERKQVVTLLKSTDLERLARQPVQTAGGTLIVGNPDGSLPGAATEARSIAGLFPGANVLIEDEATLDRVKAGAGAKYLHLATHGILNRDDPNLSYLVLGKGDKLDIADIAGLELGQMRMVTLSACETALGEDPSAQGELTTLADAFGFAGCPTVTASLWKVSDDSTKLLMENYYTALKNGDTPAASIQKAQISLIKEKSTRHPYHWAAFLLIGDWR
jgi:CHAT domain-containing protein